MSAKEMFEKSGYVLYRNDESFLVYNKLTKTVNIHIKFYIKDKKVIKEDFCNGMARYLTLEELQAINKQVEELGWLDER